MEPRRVDFRLSATVFGLLFAIAVPSSGQQDRPALNHLKQVAGSECDRLRTASIADLNTEEEWLLSLVRDSDARTKENAEEYIRMAYGSRRPGETVTKEILEAKMEEVQDGILELQLLDIFGDIVRVCIKEQRLVLQKERRLRGKYLAHCTAPQHSIPESMGDIDLELFSDNTIKVTVTEQTERVQIFGKMYGTGDFFAGSKEGQVAMIHLDGKFQTFDPLTASGEIFWSREFEGYGRVQCKGRWRSQ
jgi:hypothetical protein